VESFGTAHSNATVTVNLQPTHQHGEYYRAELAVNNSTALWQAVTNIGVLNDGSNPDIVTTNLSYLFVPATSTTLSYDPDGNLTNDGHFSYVWNSENQLTSVASLTNTPAESKRRLTFEYDALGRRIRAGVSRWTNNTWLVTSSNKFVYDGWNLVAELNATNNALVRSYAWGLDLSNTEQDAGGVGGLLWVNDASTLGSNSTHCVAYDGNGNVTALVDAGSGNETARYEYGPFGDLTQASGLMARANPIRFSSKYHDDATGLIYYGYRYYSPTLQRWLNRDPLGEEGGLNLYGFVENDPVNGFDPLGMEGFWSTFFSGSAKTGRAIAPRILSRAKEYGLTGSDMIGFGLASLYGAGGDYEGNSQLFQKLGSRAHCYNPAELQSSILWGTLHAEANIATLGLLGLGEAADLALTTGDYTGLQDEFFAMAVGLGATRLSQTALASRLATNPRAVAAAVESRLSQATHALAKGIGDVFAGDIVPSKRTAGSVMNPASLLKAGNVAKGVTRPTTTVLSDVTVVSHGKVVGRGDVYLRPTLEGIKSGKIQVRDIFENRPPKGKTTPELPVKRYGYYEEFVHLTPGVKGAGSQRIVRGASGELYYTPDHYYTFIKLN